MNPASTDRLAELETTLRYDRASDAATVFTCEKGLAASLLRRGMKPIRENRRGGRVESWIFEVPKSWITVRPPRKLRLTPQQRQTLRERAVLLQNHGLSPSPARESVQGEG
jgi:hypothetical protein